MKIEELLIGSGKISSDLGEDEQWKCHLIFFVGRIYYESELYYSCVKKGLSPSTVLYSGEQTPKLFKEVTRLVHEYLSEA